MSHNSTTGEGVLTPQTKAPQIYSSKVNMKSNRANKMHRCQPIITKFLPLPEAKRWNVVDNNHCCFPADNK